MRNEIEKIVKEALDAAQPDRWTYEPGRITFSQRYLPDFMRDDGTIIEVKGKARPEDLSKIGRINEILQSKKIDLNLPNTLKDDEEISRLSSSLKEALSARGYNLQVEYYLDFKRFIVAPLVHSVTLLNSKKSRPIQYVPLKTCSGETLIKWLDYNGVECAPITYSNQQSLFKLLDKPRRVVL